MVLVDSSHEESLQHVGPKVVRIPDLSAKQFQLLIDEGKASRPRTPEPDQVPSTIFPPYDKLPPQFQDMHLWALRKVLPLVKNWGLNLQPDLSRLYQLRTTNPHPLGNIPLAVLTASHFDVVQGPDMTAEQARQDHLRLQSDLAELSTNSTQIMVSNRGHEVYLYQPDAVAKYILAVVSAARNHSRLQKD
jgi:hypothetical protein